jgi:hypothetical protein
LLLALLRGPAYSLGVLSLNIVVYLAASFSSASTLPTAHYLGFLGVLQLE